MRRNWKGAFALVGVPVGLVFVTCAALAADQVKGGSYRGGLVPAKQEIVVSFRVSSSGKQVTALQISNTPLYCSGGGRPTPVHFKNAAISGNGTFTSSGRYVIQEGPKKGQVGTKLKISGKFLKGEAERGELTTTYLGVPNSCGGKSSYTTKA